MSLVMVLVALMAAFLGGMGSRLAGFSVIAGLSEYGQASNHQRYEEYQQYKPLHCSSLIPICEQYLKSV